MKKTNRELKKSGPRRGQNKDTYKTKASNNNSNSGSGILPQCCYRQNGTVLAQDCNNCTRPGLYCSNCPPPVSESSSKTNIERRLSNVIKRNISEMAFELTEEKKCNAQKNGNSECAEGQWCNGYGAKGGKCEDIPDWGMVSGGNGKGKGKHKLDVRYKSDRLPISKAASKHIVKSLKEDLLTERKWCWWRSNMEDQGGNKCEKSRNLDFSNEDCQTRAHCLGPDGENVVQTNNGGIKTRGKKLRQAKEASKHLIKIKESELINLVKRTLLNEEVECEKHSDCKDTCNRAKCGGGECYIPWGSDPCVPSMTTGKGETKTFSGPWSDVANIVRQAKAAGGFNNMSEHEVLLWIRDEMEGGPGVGQKKACQGANQFGGGRCCLTLGWKKVGLKCTIGKMKK